MQVSWNSALILLSVALAVIAAYTSLKLASRLAHSAAASRWRWLACGAFAMGVGIWSMHFVGMLAMQLPIELHYDVAVTIESLLIAIATSGLALHIASTRRLARGALSTGGLLMGGGIAAMHYLGMAAIRVTPAIHYDARWVAASLAYAVAASELGVWLSFRMHSAPFRALSLARLGAALVLGAAIAGTHYLGVAAAGFDAAAFCSGGIVLAGGWAAAGIAVATLSLLTITLLTAFFNAHLQYRADAHRRLLDQAQTDLRHQHTHDALTGLPNREEFGRVLRAAIAEEQAVQGSLAVLALDIDRFKVINDAIGHEQGDRLLVSVGQRLTRLLRPGDLVARSGGDEFLVLLRQIDNVDQVAQVGKRLLRDLRQPYDVEGTELFASMSIGASLYPLHALAAADLVAHADEAMYAAKQRGRDRCCLFSADTRVYTPERLQLEADLRHAVPRGQLELHYQPQLNIASGHIVGLEALVRWRHPTAGLIAPDRFIGLAEESGQIAPLSAWVIDEACRQMRAWQNAGLPPMRIAVNLSALQIGEAGLAQQVRAALERHGLAAHCLEVEITESAVMDQIDLSVQMLGELRAMGVQVAIDDFGTGYSSLSYLKRLPIQRLKIDRSFVADLGASNESDSIANAIVALGRGLRMQVIAEGVETLEQLECLRALGCDEYQGFFCSRALPAAEIPAFVRGWEAAAPASGASTVRAAG